MRKIGLFSAMAAAAMLMAAGPGAVGPNSGPHVVEVPSRGLAERPAAPAAPSERTAIREQAATNHRYRAWKLPTKHKNRASGERANRKWRKRRAAGRS